MKKDPLEYNEEELRYLSVDELKELAIETEQLESRWNTTQLVSKTLINSLYGSLANKYFLLFNEEMAAGITANGRFFIRKLAKYIEDELQRLFPQEKDYIVYGDTDSTIGTTLVHTENGQIPIEKLYNDMIGTIEIRGKNNFIKHISNEIKVTSLSKNLKLESKKIKYISKHKVKKQMFKITCDGDEVIITEDHSIMVLRDDKLISVKPTEIIDGDKIVKRDKL